MRPRPGRVRRGRMAGAPGPRIIGPMVITTGVVRARVLATARFAVLALASLLVAHTVIYLARYGAGADFAAGMSAEGHDAYWPAFVLVVGTVTFVVAAALSSMVTGGPSSCDHE